MHILFAFANCQCRISNNIENDKSNTWNNSNAIAINSVSAESKRAYMWKLIENKAAKNHVVEWKCFYTFIDASCIRICDIQLPLPSLSISTSTELSHELVPRLVKGVIRDYKLRCARISFYTFRIISVWIARWAFVASCLLLRAALPKCVDLCGWLRTGSTIGTGSIETKRSFNFPRPIITFNHSMYPIYYCYCCHCRTSNARPFAWTKLAYEYTLLDIPILHN